MGKERKKSHNLMMANNEETKASEGKCNSVDPQRSANMARVKGKDTGPELLVRRILHSSGKRYRLHARELPGCPDIVFRGLRKAIFVHGCFWHRHWGCPRASTPRTRVEFWEAKFDKNRERDRNNQDALRELGWSFLIVWECETKEADVLRGKLLRFLE